MAALNNVRFIEPAPVSRTNPLIAALIEQLPPGGTAWPAAQRQAWLHMMETTFTIVYGGPGGGEGVAGPRARVAPRKAAARRKPAAPRSRNVKRPAAPAPEFYIDVDGHARNGRGDSILPEDVNDVLYDRRGESGDLGSIVWADGSRGIPKGMRLDISASG